jgi:hypothetical protein
MSPWRSQGVLQFGFSVVESDASVERVVEVDLGTGEAEAAALGRDLEATALPLHDVVVTDHTGMNETADAVQTLGCRAPGRCGFAWATGEAAVVVGDKAGEHGVGRVQIAGLGQTEFAGEAVLQHAPEAFDATFGLWAAMKETPSCSRARPN